MPDVRENLRVVMVRTRNPLNLGAAARAMSNFGFTHLRVVNPYEVAFREARSAVGATVCWRVQKSTRAWPMRLLIARSWLELQRYATANCSILCAAWSRVRG